VHASRNTLYYIHSAARCVREGMLAPEQENSILRSQSCSIWCGDERLHASMITLYYVHSDARIVHKYKKCKSHASAKTLYYVHSDARIVQQQGRKCTQAGKHCITFTALLVLCRERDEIGLQDGSEFTRQARRLLYKTDRRL
jgi:ribosomal protein L24E